MTTVVHVTHDPVHRLDGIGAVLHGLLTSREYLAEFQRNILVGPCTASHGDGEQRLGPGGEVLYSSLDGIRRTAYAAQFRQIQDDYRVGIVYGRRRFTDPLTGAVSVPEVLLIDTTNADLRRLGDFKYTLWEKFHIDSGRHEATWDFEQWLRLAEPAVAALNTLAAGTELEPAVVLSHDYIGIPTALSALTGLGRGCYRSVFYAHEIATVRRIIEQSPGHDTMFYNVLRGAIARGQYLDDVFGDQSGFHAHGLIRATRYFDGVFAVGDRAMKELRFLGPEFAHVDATLCYNGVPSEHLAADRKQAARRLLRQYCRNLLGFEPDWVFTHVARLSPSKALWRDLRLMEQVEPLLAQHGESAVLLVLANEAPPRRPDDVRRMEHTYRWPVAHREGLPDLSPGEASFYAGVQEFNARSRFGKVVYINQFGFDAAACGARVPAGLTLEELRRGTDAVLGQSIYEPFGIAQVEPLGAGAISVVSGCCGCAGFITRVAAGEATPNVLIADYADLGVAGLPVEQLMSIGQPERDEVERRVAAQVAAELVSRLPRTAAEAEALMAHGSALAGRMSWDAVAREFIVPGIQRALKAQRLRQIA